MLVFAILALGVSAGYCGVTYLLIAFAALSRRTGLTADQVENYTFHLGLCFILSAGFLGLLLK